MAEQVEIRTIRREAGVLVASACGPVVPSTTSTVHDGLAKLFAEGVPVLLDVSGLEFGLGPAPEVS